MLKVGDKIIAVNTSRFPDSVTAGNIYEVVEVWGKSFRIINDDGEVAFPIEAGFRKYEEE